MLTIFLAAALAPPPPAPPTTSQGFDTSATAPVQIAGSISDSDYPAAAIRQGAQGTTAIRVTVGPAGDVARCEIHQSSGNEALDAASCALVTTRFRYRPARNASGRPITSVVTRRITWRMPSDAPAVHASSLPLLNFASGMLRVTLGGTASERPRCAAEAIGTAFEPHMPLQCFGFEPAALAELADEPLRIVTILRLQPEGASPPPASGVAGGTLVTASAATIEVDPEGRIIQCTPVPVADPGSAGNSSAHLCDSLYPGMPAFAAPTGSAKRRATYQAEVYRIGGEPRPTT